MLKPLRHLSVILVTLAFLCSAADTTAQSALSPADLEAFLYSNVLSMELTEEARRADEAERRTRHEENIAAMKTEGYWDDLSEEQQAEYDTFHYSPPSQTVELIPGLGALVMEGDQEFSMPRIEPHPWSVDDRTESLHIRVGSGSYESTSMAVLGFDRSRLTVAMPDRDQLVEYDLTPIANTSAAEREADKARLVGAWRLARVGEFSLPEPLSVLYEFEADGTFRSHVEGAEDTALMGAPPRGTWYLSASHAARYDVLTDEPYAARLVILASDEIEPALFTVTQLDDTTFELRGDSMLGVPTLRFAR